MNPPPPTRRDLIEFAIMVAAVIVNASVVFTVPTGPVSATVSLTMAAIAIIMATDITRRLVHHRRRKRRDYVK